MSFPVGYGVTKADADILDSWWSEDRGGYIQPTEFLLGRGGTVLGGMYASGQVGRMGADEAIRLITRRVEQDKANLSQPKNLAKEGEP